jgi:hypothetical protein
VSVPVSKSKPVRLLAAAAAGTAVLAGGLPALTPDRFDWIGAAAGLVGLIVTAGLVVYTEGQVTPWEDVAAKRAQDGGLVAGPATSITTGAAVEVTPSTPGNWTS